MNESTPSDPRRSAPGWLAFSPVLVLAALLAASWNSPVLDQHGFRQTQTLVSAYWMAHGGPWLIYQTPLFGYPWQVPFEFPVYQWLVALLATLPFGLNIDTAGRLVSAMALVACVWPVRRVLRGVGAPGRLLDWTSFLFLLSPIHLFWGRAAMIESTALLLALMFVESVQRLSRHFRWSVALQVVMWASLAALVKITTFLPFAVLGGGFVAVAAMTSLRGGRVLESLRLAVVSLAAIVVAVACLLAWLRFGDAAKLQSPLAAFSTTDNLSGWNLDRSPLHYADAFWRQTVLGRMVPDILGYAAWLALGSLALLSRTRVRWLGWAAVCLALFLVPMLVFTKLHYLHNYYQMANAVFLVVALAIILHGMSESWSKAPTAVLALLAAVGMLLQLHGGYWQSIAGQRPDHRSLILADLLRRHTDPDEVIIGMGLDWSSEVPYYSERRAILLMQNESVPLVPALLKAPANGADVMLRVGAIVRCGLDRPELSPLLPLLCSDASEFEVAGCSVIVHRPGVQPLEPAQCQDVLASLAAKQASQVVRSGLAKAPQEVETQAFQRIETCSVDFIGGTEAADQVRGTNEVLVLRGWFIDPVTGTRPVAPFVRLKSVTLGRSWLAPLDTVVQRSDLAASYGPIAAASGGFEAALPLSALTPGRYEVSLLNRGSVPAGECGSGQLLFVN